MTPTDLQLSYDRPLDLAGYCHRTPNYFHSRQRLNYLVDRYLSPAILSDRLADLPEQFVEPHQRPWERCDWQGISVEQIVGVDPALFVSLIAASAEVEAPIRAYAEISRDYLESIHPAMTRFISGSYDASGKLVEVGVWEKEERQHAPIFCQLYRRLMGEKLEPRVNSVAMLPAAGDRTRELYRHAIRRITTEWSAVAVYLWLMAHSTGALQQAIAQPLQDEVNHLAKFWGMARWGFADSPLDRLTNMVAQVAHMFDHHQGERDASGTILQLGNLRYGAELTYTFARVLLQIQNWDAHLQPDLLVALFGPRPQSQGA